MQDWIETHGLDTRPVAGGARPPFRMTRSGPLVDLIPPAQNGSVESGMAITRSDESDRAVQVHVVVPVDEPTVSLRYRVSVAGSNCIAGRRAGY
jgi:hypothetical protein